MGCIYIIKNSVNDKVYIGQTSTDISIRMRAHRYSSKYKQGKLYDAMRKLGVNKFWIELICHCNNDLLNQTEIEYIAKYDSFNNGYNSTRGGGVNILNINDTYGDDISILYQEGMTSGDIAKLIGCSDVTILNILESRGIVRRHIRKPIVLIEENKQFDSIVDAARYLNDYLDINESNIWNMCSRIIRCCRSGKSLYNYHFAYKVDMDNGSYKMSDDKTKEINLHCRYCNKPITRQSKTGYCLRCATIMAKAPGKPMKPSKEELKALLDSGLQKKQIAEIYGRTDSTIHSWINSYGLR